MSLETVNKLLMDRLEQFLAIYFGIYPQWKHWNKLLFVPAKIWFFNPNWNSKNPVLILRYISKDQGLRPTQNNHKDPDSRKIS